MISLYKREYNPSELSSVDSVLQSGWLTRGKLTETFERQLSNHFGKSTTLLSSCTAALNLAVILAGIGKETEVITTPLTFVATINAIRHVGAFPVFTKVKADGCIDEQDIISHITPQTRAILPVHYAGNMCDMKTIGEIAKKYNLKVIEDCAHAVEPKSSVYADFSCYSFYTTKNLSIGEGGAITYSTNDKELIMFLSTHGDKYIPGYKYNFTDMLAAIGIIQLEKLQENLERRDNAFGWYKNYDLPLVTNQSGSKHLLVIRTNKRQLLQKHLTENGIGTSIHFPLLGGNQAIGEEVLSLPFYPSITKKEVDYICNVILEKI